MVGGGGGQPLLACAGTSGVTGEKGTMSKMSVDCGSFMEMLPACVNFSKFLHKVSELARGQKTHSYFYREARQETEKGKDRSRRY